MPIRILRPIAVCSDIPTQAEKHIRAAIACQLLHPGVIAAYFDELRLALADERRGRIAGRASLERRLAEFDKENGRIVEAIVKGVGRELHRADAGHRGAARARREATRSAARALPGKGRIGRVAIRNIAAAA